MKRLLICALLLTACRDNRQAQHPARYDIGSRTTEAQIAAYNIDVNSKGAGLPPGSGDAVQGAVVFSQKCAVCHGAKGEGQGAFPRLIDAEPRDSFPFGRDVKLVKTIGNYWPYATTVFDYVRRSMPLTAPGSLQSNEIYSVVAYLLAENRIIARNTIVDAQSLPKIKMPARDHFVRDNRAGGAEFR